jgi:hypothetical protein
MATSEWAAFIGASLGKAPLDSIMSNKEKIFYFYLEITNEGFVAKPFNKKNTKEYLPIKLDDRLNKSLSDFFADPKHIPTEKMVLVGIINFIETKFTTGFDTLVNSSWTIDCDDIHYSLEENIAEFCEEQFYDYITNESYYETKS